MNLVENICILQHPFIAFRLYIYSIQLIISNFHMIMRIFHLSAFSILFQRFNIRLHDVTVFFIHPAVHEIKLLNLRHIHESVVVTVMFHPHILVMR